MSLIKLQGNASGTGALTIAAPNTNTDRTLTLPDTTGTIVMNEGSGIFKIDSSGNVLVGKTTSTGSRFEVERTDNDNVIADFKTNNASGDVIIRSSGGYVRVRATGTNEMAFLTAGTERARIDADGTLLIGRSADVSAATRLGLDATSSISGFVSETGVSTSITHGRFYNPNGNVGNISTNASATTYATSSDYRLKENVTPMQNALDTVAQLNPVTYTWKADGSAGQGFIAHELQAVVPDCVTGKKDAVDETGNPQYQGVDTSFLVATLVKAIQEQQSLITDLTARLTALEAN